MRDLDPNASTSLYLQVAAAIREAILSGEFKPGDQLPSRADLQERYGIAHRTVARAIQKIQRERLVICRRGSGTYVRTPPALIADSDPHARLVRQLEIRDRIQVLRTRQDVLKSTMNEVSSEDDDQAHRALSRLTAEATTEERELLDDLFSLMTPESKYTETPWSSPPVL